jgi:hypothetical protein
MIPIVVEAEDNTINREYISASPDLLAAFAVAWDAHKAWSKEQGNPITEENLGSFSWYVDVVREKAGTIHVSFGPPKPEVRGGGTEYVIDAATFKVVEQRFTK